MIESVHFILTNESNVEIGLTLEARGVWKAAEGGDSTEDRVGLQTSQPLMPEQHSRNERQTCVPPSPGRVLYHKPSWGPSNGS